MITQSGCFGRSATANPIDDIHEAAEALGDIVVSTAQPSGMAATNAAVPSVTALLNQYIRRVRLLTWAVVAIVVVMVMREVD